MKKSETKIVTDRFEALLVRYEPEASDMYPIDDTGTTRLAAPESYLLIGPPEGPFARISGPDITTVTMLLQQVESAQLFFPRIARPPRGICPV